MQCIKQSLTLTAEFCNVMLHDAEGYTFGFISASTMCDSIIFHSDRHAPQPGYHGVRSSYLMSAPAMKHPGFVDMRTALLTSLLAQISFIISVNSFCIWTDSVLTCEMSILITALLQISEK